MTRIGILVFQGFEEMDALGPWEVFRGAEEAGAAVQTKLVTTDGRPAVRGAKGLTIVTEDATCLDDEAAEHLDWLVVPGGGWAGGGAHGVWGEIQRGALPRRLRALAALGVGMASVCTGAMLLSAAGLTRGRPASTHTIARQALAAEGGEVSPARVVDDGDLITAGGVTAGIDLALWLTERVAGSPVADRVATNMEHKRHPELQRGPRFGVAPKRS